MSHALLQAWDRTVRRHGNDRAVVQAGDGTTVTFRELNARAEAWRAAHAASDLTGRAVVFAAPNGIGWLEVFLGLLKAGAVVVPPRRSGRSRPSSAPPAGGTARGSCRCPGPNDSATRPSASSS